MTVSAQNLCRLAGELAAEHGALARAYAQRAYRDLEGEGRYDSAAYWLALSVLVDDVMVHGLDPNTGPSIQ